MASIRHPMVPLSAGAVSFHQHYGHIGPIDALMYTGEAVRTREPVEIVEGLSSSFGFLLVPNRCLGNEDCVKVLWYIEGKMLSRHVDGLLVPVPQCPPQRSSIIYPPTYVTTNMTQWIPSRLIVSEAFVFTALDIENGTGAFSLGMENTICVTCKWNHGQQDIISFPPNFQSPYCQLNADSYSRRKYQFLQSIAHIFHKALCKIGTYPRNSVTYRLPCSNGDWIYLKNRFSEQIETHERHNCTVTRIVMRGYGAREAIRTKVTTYLLRIDTDAKLRAAEAVLGNVIRVGVRIHPRNSQPMRKRDGDSQYSSTVPLRNDTVYGFFNLGDDVADEGRIVLRTNQRGFDILYNPLLSEVSLRLRFKEGSLKSPQVKQALSIRIRSGDARRTTELRSAVSQSETSSVSSRQSSTSDDNGDDDSVASSGDLLRVNTEFQEGSNMYTIVAIPTKGNRMDIVECRVTESDVAVLDESGIDPMWKAYLSVDERTVLYRQLRSRPMHATDLTGPENSVGKPAVGDIVYFKAPLATELTRKYHIG